MASLMHSLLLRLSPRLWNFWRDYSRQMIPDLSNANLAGAKLSRVNLYKADLTGANLSRTDLARAILNRADLSRANLADADLSGADLFLTNLYETDFARANLSGAYIEGATLVKTNFQNSILSNCQVYGCSVWNIKLDKAQQRDIVITEKNEPIITVDNLEVAQFIYLLMNNERLRDVINTVTSKCVLILGRFTDDRKDVLNSMKDELRRRDWLPIIFDFVPSTNRDLTETVSILAHMARFVIADITDARSIPQELMAIVPSLPSVPVQPILLSNQKEYGMFEHFRRFPWVLEPFIYENKEMLLASLAEEVIAKAESKAEELKGQSAPNAAAVKV